MANYGTPSIGNLTSLFEYANTVTNSMFGPVLVLITFLIAFIALMKWRMENALLSSLFVTFVISVLLWSAGLIMGEIVAWLMVALAGVLVMQWFNSQ